MSKDETGSAGPYMATLVRGRVYVFRRIRFERQVPKEVTSEVAAELEDLYDELQDNDPDAEVRQTRRKPLFKVERVEKVAEATKFAPRKPKAAEASASVKPRPRPVSRLGGGA